MNDSHCIQATLPVKDGGLGIRSVIMLAASAVVTSVAGTRQIQHIILPLRQHNKLDSSQVKSVDVCKKYAVSEIRPDAKQGKQKERDDIIQKNISKELINSTIGPLDQAYKSAAAISHAEDWLLAPFITSVRLRMSNKT